MGTFVVAYSAVWTVVAAYLLWLGARQRRLQRIVEALELHFEESEIHEEPTSEAA